jgi:hypothetical protein
MVESTGSREGLDLPIGTEDALSLKEATIKIVRVEFMPAKEGSKAIKLVCHSKHPDRDEMIELSNAKIIRGNRIESVGLWRNLDKSGNLQKGSSLADFLIFMGVKTPKELEGKEVETVLDGKYLVLKAYK